MQRFKPQVQAYIYFSALFGLHFILVMTFFWLYVILAMCLFRVNKEKQGRKETGVNRGLQEFSVEKLLQSLLVLRDLPGHRALQWVNPSYRFDNSEQLTISFTWKLYIIYDSMKGLIVI